MGAEHTAKNIPIMLIESVGLYLLICYLRISESRQNLNKLCNNYNIPFWDVSENDRHIVPGFREASGQRLPHATVRR